jgi:hypothetical protein
MVILVTAILFGIYAAYGGTIVFNEVGTAVSYFEPGPSVEASSQYGYYLFSPWSPSHGNEVQSMINAMYATGMGWIITGIADLINAAVGHQALTGATAVSWVAGFIVGLYYGATSLEAATEASAETGVALSLSSAILATIGGLAVGYLAALSVA